MLSTCFLLQYIFPKNVWSIPTKINTISHYSVLWIIVSSSTQSSIIAEFIFSCILHKLKIIVTKKKIITASDYILHLFLTADALLRKWHLMNHKIIIEEIPLILRRLFIQMFNWKYSGKHCNWSLNLFFIISQLFLSRSSSKNMNFN